jgi:hypothetical protein
LDNVYVWHGCGSSDAERQAAQQYASRLEKDESSVIQLHEGENDTEELFWMALGDDDFARADYWRWRRSSIITDPQIWRVDAKSAVPVSLCGFASWCLLNTENFKVIPIDSFGTHGNIQESVHIIDCVWEYFIMIGSDARGERLNIRLALDVAEVSNNGMCHPLTERYFSALRNYRPPRDHSHQPFMSLCYLRGFL